MEKDDKLDFVSLVINLVMILASYAGYMFLKSYKPLKIDRNKPQNTVISKVLDKLPHPSVKRVINRIDKMSYKYNKGYQWFFNGDASASSISYIAKINGDADTKFLNAIFKNKSVVLRNSGNDMDIGPKGSPLKLQTFFNQEPKLYIHNGEAYDEYNALEFIYMRVENVVYVYKYKITYNDNSTVVANSSVYELFMYIQFPDVYLANMLVSVMYPYMYVTYNDTSF